ncbi:unnamed protein product [Blepharisma stoltei]|uniref:Uncharacterized protein n=1 Tax=Blepharisma stoltei TaxID=1481888 RepID=A0AAU9K172_9CILI|nr:unnamed protein product [Blepharisma stoltei]
MIGPPLAGVLSDNIGFENSEAAISLVLFLYIGIFVYFTKSFKCKVYEESVSPIMKNKVDVPYDTVALEDISVNP